MDFLPIYLDIRNKSCVVIGGGPVAARRVDTLLRAGAQVTVISPQLCSRLEEIAHEQKIRVEPRNYLETDLDTACLAIAATDSEVTNRSIAAAARNKRIPVNVVDQPDLCSFIMPAIIDRSPVIAAVSTGGASPVLTRLIKARLESLIPNSYGRLAELARRYRSAVKQRFESVAERQKFWQSILQGGVAEYIFSGRDDEADIAMERALQDDHIVTGAGEVYLVGAGPGDPDLLTFRALRLMQQADVVVYDRLVAASILELTRADAERIYVGKERSKHAMRQEEINQTLANIAKQGKRVLRLKGGDPFIFGRGGEEIDTLAAQGVPFQVVPGITAAAGCASYSGIPLTHRDYAQSVTFVTGHLKDGTTNLNWSMLAQPNQTVVFYMGLVGLPVICRELQAHGVPEDMPIALIEQGTTQQQKVWTGTLDTIPSIVEQEKPKPPTLIIVGQVVKLREKLSWFKAPEHGPRGATSPVIPEHRN